MAEIIQAQPDARQNANPAQDPSRPGPSTESLAPRSEGQDTDGPPSASVTTRLLGYVPRSGLDALLLALNAVPGPPVEAHRGPAVAALVQPEPLTPLLRRDRTEIAAGLLTVQRRLEIACQAGPFLPMDPAAACCATDHTAAILETGWGALTAALGQYGHHQQWDIVLRWNAEPIVARNRETLAVAAPAGPRALADAIQAVFKADRARREAALLRVLGPVVIATAANGAAGADTELCVTILVTAGGDAAVEAALDSLDAEYGDNATIDMRGPLPPLSFSAVRLIAHAPLAVRLAWQALELPGRADRATVHRHWRRYAAAAHPDRGEAPSGASVSDLTAAQHLLRDLLPGHGFATLADVVAKAGPRLVIPTTVREPELEAAL
jgi:hypothetical protein